MGSEELTKTANSERTVFLLPTVREALLNMKPLHADAETYVFTNKETGGPINQGEWAREFWWRPLRALNIRPRKFYATKHTFVSVAITRGVNLKFLAEQVGATVGTLSKHYGRFMFSGVDAQLRLLMGQEAAPCGVAVSVLGGAKSETVVASLAAETANSLKNRMVPTGIEPVLPT